MLVEKPMARTRSECDTMIAPHVHQPLIQTIVDELNGEGACPSTGTSAARTSWVVDEVLKDLRAGV